MLVDNILENIKKGHGRELCGLGLRIEKVAFFIKKKLFSIVQVLFLFIDCLIEKVVV